MTSCKVNWDKVKELGIEITPQTSNLKKLILKNLFIKETKIITNINGLMDNYLNII